METLAKVPQDHIKTVVRITKKEYKLNAGCLSVNENRCFGNCYFFFVFIFFAILRTLRQRNNCKEDVNWYVSKCAFFCGHFTFSTTEKKHSLRRLIRRMLQYASFLIFASRNSSER